MKKGLKIDQLYTGCQIACVPDHCESLSDPDVEFGFVFKRGPDDESVFCRYWSKHEPHKLRTIANSELTPTRLLVPHRYTSPGTIDACIRQILWQKG